MCAVFGWAPIARTVNGLRSLAGAHLFDEEGAKLVPEILKAAKDANVEIILPVDFTVSSKFGEDGEIKEVQQSSHRCTRAR